MTLPPPDLAAALRDRYVLQRQLGRGGMATVYLARDLKHERPVALKVLHPELAATLGPERFLREVRTTARLQHPHILPVLDSGEAAGQLWYTMPYVRGESLRERLRREVQLPVEVAVDLARQVALALDYAHREGVVHRDLKPENILLSEGQALVADFGVAKALVAGGESQLTGTGMSVGTPAYMSPEQASAGQVDARSDTYALGCVLYEMLAGEPPFTGPTPQAILAKRVLEPVPHLRTLRDSVPEPLEQAITRALAKAPADRFATAAEFARALVAPPSAAVPGGTPPPPATTVPRTRRPARGVAALGLGALGALALGISAVLWRSRAAPASLDAGVVAVAPFDVLDPKLQLWREGLMDLLARNLDGAGPLRTVSPTVVIRRWSGRADRTSATALGRQMGAELALYGTLMGSGPDSVRLTASLLDVSRGAVVGEVDLRGTADRMDQLADSLTVLVLRDLGETRPIGAARSGGLGSRSLASLRAFLRGEQYFRRTEWDSARASYDAALALDTAFALAYWRLGTIRAWQYGTGDSLGHVYSRRAAALNRGLPPRESLLVACDSLMSTLEEGALPDSAGRENLRRLFGTTELVTGRYAKDPEAWVALGEARFHFGAGLGVSDAMTLEAFEQAIELDSSYAPAYIHPAHLALYLNDQTSARRYVRRYLSLHPGGQTALAARMTSLLLDPATQPAQIDRALDTIPSSALVDTWFYFLLAPDSAEVAIRLVRRLAGRHVSEEVWFRDPVIRQGVLAVTLGFRGHLREAARLVTAAPELTDWPLFAELALAGAIAPDTAAALYRRRLEKQPFWSPPHIPAAEGFLMAPAWWAARRDTASLKRYVERVEQRASGISAPETPRNPYWLAAGKAYLALARGDTATALTRLAALPDSMGPVWLERLTRARLLSARGRAREALAVLDREFPDPNPWISRGIWALERARLAEQIGEREKARSWYGYVVNVWRHADPELQEYVAEARGSLERLTAERRR